MYVMDIAAPTWTREQIINKSLKTWKESDRYFIIDCIEFREDNPVDSSRVIRTAVVLESFVELHKLINSFVSNESLSNEKNKIRLVDVDKLKTSMDIIGAKNHNTTISP